MRYLELPRLRRADGTRAAREGGLEILSACVGGRTRIIARVVTAVYDEALRPTGLRAGQLTLLAIAACASAARAADLEELLAMDGSTVSRNVAVLAAHGWIEKVPDESGRGFSISLTAAGRRKLRSALPIWRRAQKRAEARLASEHFAALRSAGDALIAESSVQIKV